MAAIIYTIPFVTRISYLFSDRNSTELVATEIEYLIQRLFIRINHFCVTPLKPLRILCEKEISKPR